MSVARAYEPGPEYRHDDGSCLTPVLAVGLAVAGVLLRWLLS